MQISFDPEKRDKTLRERGLDFADADAVFGSAIVTFEDDRIVYPETRVVTFGFLDGRMVAMVWTETAQGRRIISMRKANEREQARYRKRLD